MCVSVLQLVRECKEVLKGGLLMKQYYQFMLRGVVTDPQGVQTNANIDEFEEDLQKMLLVLETFHASETFRILTCWPAHKEFIDVFLFHHCGLSANSRDSGLGLESTLSHCRFPFFFFPLHIYIVLILCQTVGTSLKGIHC